MGENVKKINPKVKKALFDWGLGVAAAAITTGVITLTNLWPGYAVLIGALAAPAIKWADKHSHEYGRNAK